MLILDVFIYLSVISATLNSTFEAKEVHEPFHQYCLECSMIRINWIPFIHAIAFVRSIYNTIINHGHITKWSIISKKYSSFCDY